MNVLCILNVLFLYRMSEKELFLVRCRRARVIIEVEYARAESWRLGVVHRSRY